MDFLPKPTNIFSFIILLYFLSSSLPTISSLSTVSISESSNQTLICTLQPSSNKQAFLNCSTFPSKRTIQIPINPNTSFSEIVAGTDFLCALRPPSSSSISIMGCWRFSSNFSNMSYKRLYRGPSLTSLDSGNSQVCGLVNGTNLLHCWQWPEFNSTMSQTFSTIAVGNAFVCGLSINGTITCLGSVIGVPPIGNFALISAGFSHACAISLDNNLTCWGDSAGEYPQVKFKSLALGENRSCGIRLDDTVVCWGANNFTLPQSLRDKYFVSIDAKRNVFCGVESSSYSLYCWGNGNFEPDFKVFDHILPGSCRSQCPCGPLPNSATLCDRGIICNPCVSVSIEGTPSPSFPPISPNNGQNNGGWSNKMVALLVVGCVGCGCFLLVFGFFLFRYCKGRVCRVHDSGRLDDEEASPNQQEIPQTQQPNLPVLEKRLSNLVSMGNGGHWEEFSLQVLLEATNNFSEEHKIGRGSFGSVYYAKLEDGREVAIKRAEISSTSQPNAGFIIGRSTRRQELDNDNAFLNELESLSRLNHKNLVRLLGFCEETTERILVYEYMNNGTLSDHLHTLESSPLMSWETRLKVALDAARGIEYLHVYATPPVIHRDIKSSNILLDDKWTAKVSDFGLSLMGPPDEESHLSVQAAGTVGYLDPEYYRLQKLTTKSDVYSFGIVLLELLSGYKAIHQNENGVRRNVVDIVVPYIVHDEIHRVLDPKVPPPTPFEIEAVAYVGYMAADCVSSEGRDRPGMSEIVNGLERALEAYRAEPKLSRSTTGSST